MNSMGYPSSRDWPQGKMKRIPRKIMRGHGCIKPCVSEVDPDLWGKAKRERGDVTSSVDPTRTSSALVQAKTAQLARTVWHRPKHALSTPWTHPRARHHHGHRDGEQHLQSEAARAAAVCRWPPERPLLQKPATASSCKEGETQ